MIDALYIAHSALRSQQQHLDVISNNVANLQTPGFKRQRVSFSELTAPAVAQGVEGRTFAVGAGTRISGIHPVLTDGELKPTLDPLDIALRGAGFLEVTQPDGSTAFTRAGQLKVDGEGYLAVRTGQRLTVGIQVPADATDLRIGATGIVTARLAGTDTDAELGRLELVRFSASDALTPAADNLYTAAEGAGDLRRGRPGDDGFGTVMQGFLEVSNVDMVEEMTDLVLAQRIYQLNARVLQASDQILETINNLRR